MKKIIIDKGKACIIRDYKNIINYFFIIIWCKIKGYKYKVIDD